MPATLFWADMCVWQLSIAKNAVTLGKINQLWTKIGKPNRNARVIYIYIFYLSTQHYTVPKSLKSIFNHPISIYLSHRPPKNIFFGTRNSPACLAIPAKRPVASLFGNVFAQQKPLKFVGLEDDPASYFGIAYFFLAFAVIFREFEPQKSRQYRAPEVILSMGCLVSSNALVMKITGG